MRLISSISFAFFLFIALSSGAQVVTKVKRKGVQPINVTMPTLNGSAYSLEQFSGKWQEISRRDHTNNSNVDFEDTLFFIFSGNNDLYTRNGVNFSLKGKADLEAGNILSTGADEFIIKSLDTTKAVLDDGDKYVHTMIKKQSFFYEMLPTDSVVVEKFTTPVGVNYSNIIGKWSVYRREAKPGSISTDEPILKIMNIENNSDTANSEITFYVEEKSETVPCHVTLEGTKIHLATSKHSWLMDVYKADKKEFIFGSPELMYYCKPM
ncbi:MAG: hypothetical protein ABI863_15245 [Ginsengibacter sp.]